MDYAWGGSEFIPNLIGFNSENHQSSAEYWMGAHQTAPSKIVLENEEESLDILINSHPEKILGKAVTQKYNALPYLFKILDVRNMLSIQVHPNKQQAEKGFASENQEGIPLAAPNRNYKDNNDKPELMVALSEFWLLHGFLAEPKIVKVLKSVPEFKVFLPFFIKGGYLDLYQTILELSAAEVDKILAPLINRILPLYQKGKLTKSAPDYWAARAAVNFNSNHFDGGIFSIYLFNLIKMNKNEGIFQPAGIPHAYLEGQNVELMANSDNVLRGGLTSKHIDVKELLNLVQFYGVIPRIIKPNKKLKENVYDAPVNNFILSRIELKKKDTYINKAFSLEILLIINGEVNICNSQNFQKGEVITIFAGENYLIESLANNSILFKAAVPEFNNRFTG